MHKRGTSILSALLICLIIFSGVSFVAGAAEIIGEPAATDGELPATNSESVETISGNSTGSENNIENKEPGSENDAGGESDTGSEGSDSVSGNGTGSEGSGSVSGNGAGSEGSGGASGNDTEKDPAEPIWVARPTAVTGLVYNGLEQVGVAQPPGVILTGNRGTDAKTYTAVAELQEGYVWEDGTNTPMQIEWEISRLTVSIPQAPEGLSITLGTAREYEYALSKLTAGYGIALGDLTYSVGDVTLGEYYQPAVKPAYIEDGVLKVPIQNNIPASFTNTGSIVIKVEGQNVQPFLRTISCGISTASAPAEVTKITPTGTPTISKTVVYVGDKLNSVTLSGHLKNGDVAVAGTFAWESAGDIFSTAGQVAKNWIFTPVDTAKYNSVKGSAAFTVKKIMPAGTPSYGWIYTEGHTLASAGLSKGTITVEGTVTWDLPASTVVAKNVSYRWIFVPADENTYERLSGTVVLYKDDTPAGGFAGTGSSSSSGRARPITVTGTSSDQEKSSNASKSNASSLERDTASGSKNTQRQTDARSSAQGNTDTEKDRTESGFDGHVDNSLKWIIAEEPEESVETDGGTVPEHQASPFSSAESHALYQSRGETKRGVILLLIAGVSGLAAAAVGFALFWIRNSKDYRM